MTKNRVFEAFLAEERAKLDTDQYKKNLRACYELLIEIAPEHDKDDIIRMIAEKYERPASYVKMIVKKINNFSDNGIYSNISFYYSISPPTPLGGIFFVGARKNPQRKKI